MEKIKKFNFSIFIALVFFILIIPNAYAEDLQMGEECLNDTITLTIFDSIGPISGISAYVYKDTSVEKISDKFISDKDGKIKIKFSD